MMRGWVQRLWGRTTPGGAKRRTARRGTVLALTRLERREVLSAVPLPVPALPFGTAVGAAVETDIAVAVPLLGAEVRADVQTTVEADRADSPAGLDLAQTARGLPQGDVAELDRGFELYGAGLDARIGLAGPAGLAADIEASVAVGTENGLLAPLGTGVGLGGPVSADLQVDSQVDSAVNGSPASLVDAGATASFGDGQSMVTADVVVLGDATPQPAPPVSPPGTGSPTGTGGDGIILPLPMNGLLGGSEGTGPAGPTDAMPTGSPADPSQDPVISPTAPPMADATFLPADGLLRGAEEIVPGPLFVDDFDAAEDATEADAARSDDAEPSDETARQRARGEATAAETARADSAAAQSEEAAAADPRRLALDQEVSEQLAAVMPGGAVANAAALEQMLRELMARLGQAEEDLETFLARWGVAPWTIAAVLAALAGCEVARRTARRSRTAALSCPDGTGLT